VAEKKALNVPPLAATVMAAQPDDVLELDELWTFVGHRRRGVIWLWLALCRRTRQIVAYALGPRNDATARLLWARIPPAYRQSLLYTDHLESYHNVLPAGQHQARYPKRGPTNHIERFNNTLRQPNPKLTRKTLSFAKSFTALYQHIRLFIHTYNQQARLRYIYP
jgi:IS1 family transposase